VKPLTKHLLLGTRKGLVVCTLTSSGWKIKATHFIGIPVSIAFADQRTNTWWACLDHGHWGCKIHRSTDMGVNWKEITAPQYPEGATIKEDVPATLRYIWAMSDGGSSHPNKLWLGSEPGGLFESNDSGDSFQFVQGLWDHPSRKDHWFGAGRDYAGIHSIVVDPRDNDHIFVGLSVAGVFETTDGGKTWEGRNKGLKAEYLPDHDAAYGHDPHILVACPTAPDVMWQQNHCGIFKTTDGAKSWQDVSDTNKLANFGFAIAVDHDNPNQAWVVPGDSDEIRVAVDGALCVCRTDDGGKTWTDYRAGLPQENCFDIVYRHSLDVWGDWVVFGTTTGNVFISGDRGETWDTLSNYLPMIYAVSFC